MNNPMRIVKLEAVPISFPVPENKSVRLGIGKCVKRDSVLVRIETEDGHIGWGEAHHGRAPGAIAKLIDTTMRELVLNQDATDINGIWATPLSNAGWRLKEDQSLCRWNCFGLARAIIIGTRGARTCGNWLSRIKTAGWRYC